MEELNWPLLALKMERKGCESWNIGALEAERSSKQIFFCIVHKGECTSALLFWPSVNMLKLQKPGTIVAETVSLES